MTLRSQLEKSSKANNEDTTPTKLKQNVPTVLAIFHETTVASATQFYFPDEKSTVEFLKLFSK